MELVAEIVIQCFRVFGHGIQQVEIQQGFSIPANITNMKWMFSSININIIPSSLFNQTILDNINDRNCYQMFVRSGVITIQNGFTIPKIIIELQGMFQTCNDLIYIPSTLFDTQYISSLTIDCTRMFESCNNVGIDVITIQSGFAIPPNIVSMDGMFSKSGIDKIPSSLFNQTILDNINDRTCIEMFSSCKNLITIQDGLTIPKNTTNTAHMFADCVKITELPSSIFDLEFIRQLTGNVDRMFANCDKLTTINRGFTIPPNVTNIKTIFKESKEITGLPASLFSKE